MHERCSHQVAQLYLETWVDQLRPDFLEGSRSSARAAAEIYLVKIFTSVHTPDAAKQRAFREMGQSVKPLESWPLASIELEKERRSADGQWWFVDEFLIKSALRPRRTSLKTRSPWSQASRSLSWFRTRISFLFHLYQRWGQGELCLKNEITMATGATKHFSNFDNDESISKTSLIWAPLGSKGCGHRPPCFYTNYCRLTATPLGDS